MIRSPWLIALLFLALHYAAVLVAVRVGLARTFAAKARRNSGIKNVQPTVSVVVAARNEEEHIARCVDAILANDFPADRLQLVVVDDGSTDGTGRLLADLRQRHLQSERFAEMKVVTRERKARVRAGTKWDAVQAGLACATGDIVMLTDADCVAPPTWVRTMAGMFQNEAEFVSGPVLFSPTETAWHRMQALEFLGLVAVGAGAIGAGRPLICNGANIAFRRSVLNRFSHDLQRVGSEELLMQAIAESGRERVRFCAAPEAVVTTEPQKTVRSFFIQRRRWAALAPRLPGAGTLLSLLAIYLFYVGLLLVTAASFFMPAAREAAVIAWLIKMLAEWLVLSAAAGRFGRARWLRLFLPAQPFQVPYIVYAATAGALGLWKWK